MYDMIVDIRFSVSQQEFTSTYVRNHKPRNKCQKCDFKITYILLEMIGIK